MTQSVPWRTVPLISEVELLPHRGRRGLRDCYISTLAARMDYFKSAEDAVETQIRLLIEIRQPFAGGMTFEMWDHMND